MRVTVRYFASVREALGLGTEDLQTGQSTLAGLRAELCARGGEYADSLAPERPVRMALNQVMCLDEATPLHEGCEVAFFPPVTGG